MFPHGVFVIELHCLDIFIIIYFKYYIKID